MLYFAYGSNLDWAQMKSRCPSATFVDRAKLKDHRLAFTRKSKDRDCGAADLYQDFTVGCIILQNPFFFEERDWIPAPRDFHPNIVQGKTYDADSGIGGDLWEAVQFRLHVPQRDQVGDFPAPTVPIFGEPVLVRQRLGQGTFRILITDTYRRRCAVTGEKALPTLEAAHIKPVSEGGIHRVDNGLLLRSDLHRLFDRGYVTVTPDYQFRASRKLKEDFDNGEVYLKLTGTQLWLPADPVDRPNREFLDWHAETVFRR